MCITYVYPYAPSHKGRMDACIHSSVHAHYYVHNGCRLLITVYTGSIVGVPSAQMCARYLLPRTLPGILLMNP